MRITWYILGEVLRDDEDALRFGLNLGDDAFIGVSVMPTEESDELIMFLVEKVKAVVSR